MATRSCFGYLKSNNSTISAYHHFDGYPKNVVPFITDLKTYENVIDYVNQGNRREYGGELYNELVFDSVLSDFTNATDVEYLYIVSKISLPDTLFALDAETKKIDEITLENCILTVYSYKYIMNYTEK